MLKFLTLLLAGLLTAITIKRLIDHFARARIAVRKASNTERPAITRLKQDPATGIYHPDN